MPRPPSKRGSISGKPPENEPWVWITREMLQSPLWGALSISARRIMDALLLEHMAHGGRENGNLGCTYRQLEAYGVTKADIHPGLTELEICGFVRTTRQGFRMSGGGECSRYAITWLVTFLNTPSAAIATNDWRNVMIQRTRAGHVTVRQVRKWLKEQVAKSAPKSRRARRPETSGVTEDIEGAAQVRGGQRLQVRGEGTAEIITLAPQVRGSVGGK